MMWTYGPWGGFPWMWIFLIVLFILLFIGRGRYGCGRHGTQKTGESAREILDRRYARGEINREEYQQMKKDME